MLNKNYPREHCGLCGCEENKCERLVVRIDFEHWKEAPQEIEDDIIGAKQAEDIRNKFRRSLAIEMLNAARSHPNSERKTEFNDFWDYELR